jgi:hypothetical protein
MPERGSYLLLNIQEDIAEAIASLDRGDIDMLRTTLATLAIQAHALRSILEALVLTDEAT